MKYSQFSFGLMPSFSTSSKCHVQSGITDKRHSHFLISYYRLIFQSNLFRLVPYLLQRMHETTLDQKQMTLTLSIKHVRHLEYTKEIYRTEFPYSVLLLPRDIIYISKIIRFSLQREKIITSLLKLQDRHKRNFWSVRHAQNYYVTSNPFVSSLKPFSKKPWF